jgi:hypothetical protein
LQEIRLPVLFEEAVAAACLSFGLFILVAISFLYFGRSIFSPRGKSNHKKSYKTKTHHHRYLGTQNTKMDVKS